MASNVGNDGTWSTRAAISLDTCAAHTVAYKDEQIG
jgi:hypothetical protein